MLRPPALPTVKLLNSGESVNLESSHHFSSRVLYAFPQPPNSPSAAMWKPNAPSLRPSTSSNKSAPTAWPMKTHHARTPRISRHSQRRQRHAQHRKKRHAPQGNARKPAASKPICSRSKAAVRSSSANSTAGSATRPVIFYAHYDGQPVDPSAWTDKSPFDSRPPRQLNRSRRQNAFPTPTPAAARQIPTKTTGASTLCSASDDKSPIVAILAALDAPARQKYSARRQI